MLIYNAKDNLFFTLAKRASALKPCRAMAKLGGNILLYFFGMGGYNSKLICRLGSFDNIVSDKGRNKAIQNAKANRLIIKYKVLIAIGPCINKERGYSNNSIKNKGYKEKVELGLFLADIL